MEELMKETKAGQTAVSYTHLLCVGAARQQGDFDIGDG